MTAKPRLFLDTSALFTGIWSATGGGRMLLKLGEAGVVRLLLSAQVLQEIDEVVRRKAVQFLPTLAVLIDRCQAELVDSAPPDIFEHCKTLLSQAGGAGGAGDARILADAWHNQADFLVTLDRAHFLSVPNLAAQIPFTLGTPGDCLAWLRQRLQS